MIVRVQRDLPIHSSMNKAIIQLAHHGKVNDLYILTVHEWNVEARTTNESKCRGNATTRRRPVESTA